MIGPAGARIGELSESLSRIRSGQAQDAEIVAWLRAASPMAASIPRPRTGDARRGYSRTLLYRCERFEVLALHWSPGTATAIHDHGGAFCWLAVAQGSVGVDNYVRRDTGATPGFARIDFEGREVLAESAIDYRQDDVHLHRCFTGNEPAVSLHVYARPIDRFYTFDERAQTCTPADSTYDAMLNV
ncbi:MAG TPA: cysteine dioxygenase family protein [Candidatus Baltobacteraceae bacterium]|jgi:cysteine dioxygenase|nr:cysteine dioxygenase family protein [Candidatus Baltobacteraceae bacterium]